MGTRRNAREWALQFLFQSEYNRAPSLEEGLRLFWEDLDTIAAPSSPAPAPPTSAPLPLASPSETRKARDYATHLIRGVLQNHRELDRRINASSPHWNTTRMGTVERNILRIAAFEILLQNDVPGPVAINEAVTLAKIFSSVESARFVNGLLDHLLHHNNHPLTPPPQNNPPEPT